MLRPYTFGAESKQFLILTKSQADLINLFTDAFFEAQEHFLEKEQRRWTPNDPLAFNGNTMSTEQIRQYNKLVKKNVNPQHKIRHKLFKLLHIDVANEELDDYLIPRI